MKSKVLYIILVGALLYPLSGFTQITLKEALSMAKSHPSLVRVQELAHQEMGRSIKNIEKQYLPQFSVSAQSSYQSDVTTFPAELPGIDIDPISKDQYRILGEVRQNLYDGGVGNQKKLIVTTANEIEQNNIEVELEKIREQIIQLYFNVLELDVRLRIVALSRTDLLASFDMLDAAVTNGTALQSDKNSLEAALIRLEQQTIELESIRTTQIRTMGLLTNYPVDTSSTFEMPDPVQQISQINSSKYTLRAFDLQQQLLHQNYESNLLASQPKIHLFGQGGYGKPSLNFLKNQFDPFYVLGIRANLKFGNLYTKRNDRDLLQLRIQKIDAKKEALTLQIDIVSTNYQIEINKIVALASKDEELLKLRRQITSTAKIQMENGVLTSVDYLARFNEEKAVMENLSIRGVKQRKAEYMLAHVTGNYSN